MTTRLLPADEWPKLAGTLLDPAWRAFDPVQARVLVVEEGSRIVGCAALFPAWHAEGAWIAPEYRGRLSVGRRLWVGMRRLWADLRIAEVLCMSTSAEGRKLCMGLGTVTPLECDHFAVAVEKDS